MKAFCLACLIFLSNSCVKRQNESTVASHNTNPIQEKTSASAYTRHLYLAEESSTAVDPQSLSIIRAAIAKTEWNGTHSGKAIFATLGSPDRVDWKICSIDSEKPTCKIASTARNDISWGILSLGSYEITLQACVSAERSIDPQNSCGPKTTLKWYQDPSSNSRKDLLLNELASQEEALRNLAEKTHQLLKKLKSDFGQCTNLSDKDQKEAIENAQIEFENFINLGPDFLTYGMEGVREPSTDKDLAVALLPETETNEKTNTENIDPNIQIKGLSLAEQKSLKSTLSSAYENSKSSSLILDPQRLKRTLEAGSGFVSQTGELPNIRSTRSASDQSGLLTAKILKDPRLSESERLQYASYEAVNGLLRYEAPKSSLQLAESTRRCEVFASAESSLRAIRFEARTIKNSMKTIQDQLIKLP